jgi:hypothetical protein
MDGTKTNQAISIKQIAAEIKEIGFCRVPLCFRLLFLGLFVVFLSFCVYIIKEKSSAYTFFSRTQVEMLKVVVNLEVCDATGAS